MMIGKKWIWPSGLVCVSCGSQGRAGGWAGPGFNGRPCGGSSPLPSHTHACMQRTGPRIMCATTPHHAP